MRKLLVILTIMVMTVSVMGKGNKDNYEVLRGAYTFTVPKNWNKERVTKLEVVVYDKKGKDYHAKVTETKNSFVFKINEGDNFDAYANTKGGVFGLNITSVRVEREWFLYKGVSNTEIRSRKVLLDAFYFDEIMSSRIKRKK